MRALAARLLDEEGADGLKIMATGGYSTPTTDPRVAVYPVEVLAAAADEAHKRGRYITAHAHGVDGMRAASEAGIDCLQHASMIGEDDEVTAILSAARSAVRLVAANLRADEFFVESQRRGFPAGAIFSPEEAFESEHMAARGMHDPVDHPELGRLIRYPGVPFVTDVERTGRTRRPPLLGEHDGEVDWT